MRSFSRIGPCQIKHPALVLVAMLACFTPAYGQHPECPRPALQPLAHLSGAWTVTFTYRFEGELIRADSAYAEIELAADHCALIEKFRAVLRGQPLAIVKMLVAPTPETLQQGYVDSFHGGLTVSEGYVQGDTLRFERARDWGTHIQLVQSAYFDIEADAFRTEARMSPDNGVNWVLTQRAVYRRRR